MRGLRPICFECAAKPRWLFGWRVLVGVAVTVAFLAFNLGRVL